nr:ribonuclease 3 [Quercus suber]
MSFIRDTEKGMEESLLAEEKRKSETPYLTWVTFTGELKRLGLLAGPMVAVTLSQYMLQVISIMMVGHLGELALSSTAIAISLSGVTGFSFLEHTVTQHSSCYPETGKPATDFTIHGLWPEYKDGLYPSNCDPNSVFEKSRLSDLMTNLQKDWPSLSCPSSNGFSLSPNKQIRQKRVQESPS